MDRVFVGMGPKAQTPVTPVLLVRPHCQHTEQMQLGAEAGERAWQDSAAGQDPDGGLGRNSLNLLLSYFWKLPDREMLFYLCYMMVLQNLQKHLGKDCVLWF